MTDIITSKQIADIISIISYISNISDLELLNFEQLINRIPIHIIQTKYNYVLIELNYTYFTRIFTPYGIIKLNNSMTYDKTKYNKFINNLKYYLKLKLLIPRTLSSYGLYSGPFYLITNVVETRNFEISNKINFYIKKKNKISKEKSIKFWKNSVIPILLNGMEKLRNNE